MYLQKTLFVIFLFLFGASNAASNEINVIPYPEKVVVGDGSYVLPSTVRIACSKQLNGFKEVYKELFQEQFGQNVTIIIGKKGDIVLRVNEKLELGEESYRLSVSANGIVVEAPSEKGIYYGIVTLSQLLERGADGQYMAKTLEIEDSPRFGWRGCMLDVSRTFMSRNLVKRYIKLISQLKLNVLHLHFADDQGWRIEIKRYPRLTQYGSKFDAEYNEMGGYYTQQDVREIVSYASARGVTVVPEFELPGHESAAIAAYPFLSCRNVQPKIHPFFKGPDIHEEIFCAGKQEVYEFVYNVLDELIDLFPSKYIHIGGDEAPKKEWKACPLCQKTMKDNALDNEEQLQSYFVQQIGKYLHSKGKELIGWDEIADGGRLAGSEVLMYWRGWQSAKIREMAKAGYRVISCPTTHCYFDYDYKTINTQRMYSFEPVPADAIPEEAQLYIGVQANFWSHIDRCESRIDGQLFPRLLALSEVGWCDNGNKDWQRFKVACSNYCERLKSNQVYCHDDESLK